MSGEGASISFRQRIIPPSTTITCRGGRAGMPFDEVEALDRAVNDGIIGKLDALLRIDNFVIESGSRSQVCRHFRVMPVL